MDNDFKKMDDWMMDAARQEREKRVPEKDMKEFHDGVIKKILERQRHGIGMPYVGLGMAGVLSLALILGLVIYLRPNPAAKVKPAVEQPIAVSSTTVQEKASSVEAAAPPPMTESSLVEDIEALKELGVWTDQDEEEAGIPVEVIFSDLETGLTLQQPAPPIAVTS